MEKRIRLPEDELPHNNQAIEWWYFNGFLNGKNKYAFMTTLFKADREKANIKLLSIPLKTIYFSHTLLYDLNSKKIKKEILPIVVPSLDSFSRKELFVNYFYPIKRSFLNYEISRNSGILRLKTAFFDLQLEQKKKTMLESGTGYIDFGNKSTFYYSYPNMKAEGWIGNEKVSGKAWHDKQWSKQGFIDDSWIWFSFQLPNNTEIVCFDYKGFKLATISYPDNHQESFHDISISPVKETWKSFESGIHYSLNWEINIPGFKIKVSPIISNSEINTGSIYYWEGPVTAKINGLAAQGFMELLPKAIPQKRGIINSLIEKEHLLKNLIYTG